jgi:hypothetical protein
MSAARRTPAAHGRRHGNRSHRSWLRRVLVGPDLFVGRRRPAFDLHAAPWTSVAFRYTVAGSSPRPCARRRIRRRRSTLCDSSSRPQSAEITRAACTEYCASSSRGGPRHGLHRLERRRRPRTPLRALAPAMSVESLVHGDRALIERRRLDLGLGGPLDRPADTRHIRGLVSVATHVGDLAPSSS